MRKVELLQKSPSNLPLQEAQQDAFDDLGNCNLDFEIEPLENRIALDLEGPAASYNGWACDSTHCWGTCDSTHCWS
jgi:hypothetical protein